ncbi:MAG TPA: hypothetical protein VGM65_00005 [Candidatus Udaeobacter sp.]|jgi:hypothetical protein
MITRTADDDSEFVDIASRILKASVQLYHSAEVYVVHIDNWFDVKWRGFSGKILGALGVWKRELTVPPFRPNRVLSQEHFSRDAASGDYIATNAASLHRDQVSFQNLNRDIRHLSGSALFFWYSGGSVQTGRGSIMLYRIEDAETSSWYASYQRSPDWKLLHTQQISRAELLRLAQISNQPLQPTADRSDV